MSIRLRKRHRLRKKEVRALTADLNRIFSKQCISEDDIVDRADIGKLDAILIKGEIIGLILDEKPFLSVKGLIKYRPEKRYVTVDMGAVKFLYNGADVMAPGIVDADSDIAAGDLVWIRDEKNHQPLAVGQSLMDGAEMVESDKGKAIVSLHHVGDDIWNYET